MSNCNTVDGGMAGAGASGGAGELCACPDRLAVSVTDAPKIRTIRGLLRRLSSRRADLRGLGKSGIRSISNQPSVSELDGAASVTGVRLGVRNLYDCGSLLIQIAKEFHDLLGLRRMKIACGLVSKQ